MVSERGKCVLPLEEAVDRSLSGAKRWRMENDAWTPMAPHSFPSRLRPPMNGKYHAASASLL